METELCTFCRELGVAQAALDVLCGEVTRSSQATEAAKLEVATLRAERDEGQQRSDRVIIELQDVVTALWSEVAQSVQAAARSTEVSETVTKSAEVTEAAMAGLQAERDQALRRVETTEAAQTATQTERDQAQHRAAEAEKRAVDYDAILTNHEAQHWELEETIEGKSNH
jgi:chromosome segregation ATPase